MQLSLSSLSLTSLLAGEHVGQAAFLLKEDVSFLLLEDGFLIMLEQQ